MPNAEAGIIIMGNARTTYRSPRWRRTFGRATAAERKEAYRDRIRNQYQWRFWERYPDYSPSDLNDPDHWAYVTLYNMPDGRVITWAEMTEEEQEYQNEQFRLKLPSYFEYVLKYRHEYNLDPRRLVTADMDVNAQSPDGEALLFLAISYEDADAVQVLLENGADVMVKDKQGRSPLQRAAGNALIVEMLKQVGVKE